MADDAASQEDVLKGIIGQPTGKSKVVVERGAQHFADAVLSTSPNYHNPQAAKNAGFDTIPAPPTFPFAMEFSGKFEEVQPADAPSGNPLRTAVVPPIVKGGLILHGEQELIYHRQCQVGDVLVSEGQITDAYQKESKGRTMTFIVPETNWYDEKTGEPVVTTRFNLIHRAEGEHDRRRATPGHSSPPTCTHLRREGTPEHRSSDTGPEDHGRSRRMGEKKLSYDDVKVGDEAPYHFAQADKDGPGEVRRRLGRLQSDASRRGGGQGRRPAERSATACSPWVCWGRR